MLEDLKAIRKLGFRHVRCRNNWTIPMTEIVQVLLQILNFASVIASGLMIWKGLGIVTNTESPIVVVLRYTDHSTCSEFGH